MECEFRSLKASVSSISVPSINKKLAMSSQGSASTLSKIPKKDDFDATATVSGARFSGGSLLDTASLTG